MPHWAVFVPHWAEFVPHWAEFVPHWAVCVPENHSTIGQQSVIHRVTNISYVQSDHFQKHFRYILSLCNKTLSIVIELEPNEKQNDETIWYINYGKDLQGSIITNEHEVGAPYINFGSALMTEYFYTK